MLKSFYLQKCYKQAQAIALTAKYTIMSNQEIFTKVVMYNNLKKKIIFQYMYSVKSHWRKSKESICGHFCFVFCLHYWYFVILFLYSKNLYLLSTRKTKNTIIAFQSNLLHIYTNSPLFRMVFSRGS